MKKFLVVFFIIGFMASVFAPKAAAQFYWSLGTDFNTGLFARGFSTGDRAEKLLTLDGNPEPNDYVNNPVNGNYGFNRGDYTYTPGYMDIFSYGSGQWLRGNELRLTIGYKNEYIEFHTMSLLDMLVRADQSDGSGRTNEFAPDHSFVQTPNGARTVNWGDFLRYSFEEYYFRGNAGLFTGYVGNTPDRGKVNNFSEAFTEDVMRTIMVENFGVITPDANADYLDDGQDTNNFMRSPRVRGSRIGENTADPFGWVDVPYFMIAINLSSLNLPLTIQLAADPGNNSGMNSGGGSDSRTDFDYKKMNGAVRISGEEIADWVNFDVIYRFKGGDPNTLDSYVEETWDPGIIQPDGRGIFAHTFGLYANILQIPDFGIGFGYSGYLKVFEEDRENFANRIINLNSPFFNGIDLRAQYTGFRNMVITSSNNFSFASIQRSDNPDDIAVGVLGTYLETGTSQQWIAVYNALGVDYLISDQLTASLQIGNRYGSITTIITPLSGGKNTVTRIRNQFGGGVFAAYQFNEYFRLQCGIAFRYTHDSYTNEDPAAQNIAGTRNASGGMFDFAIPIRMRIVFGNM